MITREMKVNIREFDLATKIPMFPTSHSTPMLSSTPTTPQLTSLRSRMSPQPTMNCDTRDTITRETRDLSMPHPSSIDWHRQDWGQQDKETRTWWPIFLPTAKYIKTKRVQEVLLEVMQVSADGERFLPTPAPPCPWFISASAIHERSGLVQQLPMIFQNLTTTMTTSTTASLDRRSKPVWQRVSDLRIFGWRSHHHLVRGPILMGRTRAQAGGALLLFWWLIFYVLPPLQ